MVLAAVGKLPVSFVFFRFFFLRGMTSPMSPMLQLVQRSVSERGLFRAGGRAVPLPGTDANMKLFAALEASSRKELFSGSFVSRGNIRGEADPTSAADFIKRIDAAKTTVVENDGLELELYSGTLYSLATELKIDVGVFTAGMTASAAEKLEVTLKFKQLKQEFLTDNIADLLSGFAPKPNRPDFPRKLYIVTGLWYLKQLELGAQRLIEAGTKEEAALTEAGAHVIQSATGLPVPAAKGNASVDAKSKKHVLLNMQGITGPIAADVWKLSKFHWYEPTKPGGYYPSPIAGRTAKLWLDGDEESSEDEEWYEATGPVADLGNDSGDDTR